MILASRPSATTNLYMHGSVAAFGLLSQHWQLHLYTFRQSAKQHGIF